MDEYFSAGACGAIALFAVGEDQCGHACRRAECVGVDWAFDAMHVVNDAETRTDTPARGVDDELNRLMVDGIEVEQLRDSLFGGLVVDWLRQEDGALKEQGRTNAGIRSAICLLGKKFDTHDRFLSGKWHSFAKAYGRFIFYCFSWWFWRRAP